MVTVFVHLDVQYTLVHTHVHAQWCPPTQPSLKPRVPSLQAAPKATVRSLLAKAQATWVLAGVHAGGPTELVMSLSPQCVCVCMCVCSHAHAHTLARTKSGGAEQDATHFTPSPTLQQHKDPLTADVWCPPGHTYSHFMAGLGIGSHSGAETLTVTP